MSQRSFVALVGLAICGWGVPPAAGQQAVFRDDFESGTTCYWKAKHPSTFGLPTDPSWASVLHSSSSCVGFELFGVKQGSGLVSSYDEVLTRWVWGDEVQTRLDTTGRPIEMVVRPSGVTFQLTWLSTTAALVTAVSASGEVQVSLIYDATAPSLTTAASVWLLAGGEAAGEASHLLPRGPAPAPGAAAAAGGDAPQRGHARPKTGTGTVIVTRCGQGLPDEDFFVQVSTNGAVGGTTYNLPCTYASPGTCTYRVPQMQTPSALVEDICESVAGVAGNLCEWFVDPALQSGFHHQMCLTMAAAVDVALGGPSGEGALILSACESAFIGAEAYCSTLGASPPGGPSIAEAICGAIEEISVALPAGTITLNARATVAGHPGLLQQTATAPVNGPYPTFELAVPEAPIVDSFSTVPLDPAPGQGYSATAQVSCVPPGSVVRVTITGTDGYSDAIECSLSGAGSCALGVPGAAAGVVDTLRTFINGSLSRTIAIVF